MSKESFKITLDGKEVKARKGQTILEISEENNIKIPAICYHPDIPPRSSCRLCVVEIKGQEELKTACSTEAKEGMEIFTQSEKVKRARRINLELLFAQHQEKCEECYWYPNCELLKLAQEYNVENTLFTDRKKHSTFYSFKDIIEFDSSKCINCDNCVEICDQQGVGFLEDKQKGTFSQIIPSKNKKKDCVYCGQCITHCPAGALTDKNQTGKLEKLLNKKNKKIVVQFAPSIRTSIGEEFGMEYGEAVTGKLTAALRELGFERVFDTCAGADFTSFEESKELIKRLKSKKKLPLMTSCCPAWVKYVEFYYPHLTPYLTSVRSPQIILGGIAKTYWAEKEDQKSKKVKVVSVMPCTSKKFEITRPELKTEGGYPVDCVITTRELAKLLKKRNIDLPNLPSSTEMDTFGDPSGAGIIYGSSGGVMESALRTTYEKLTNQSLSRLKFEKVRGSEAIREAKIRINGQDINVAVVNGLGNADKLLKEIEEGNSKYSYIEVMACSGGCIGGGGQPIPIDDEIRKTRAEGLYNIDTKKKIRRAHKNPQLVKAYKEYFNKNKETLHLVAHTEYKKKKKGQIKKHRS